MDVYSSFYKILKNSDKKALRRSAGQKTRSGPTVCTPFALRMTVPHIFCTDPDRLSGQGKRRPFGGKSLSTSGNLPCSEGITDDFRNLSHGHRYI